jgi:hypothetical protein
MVTVSGVRNLNLQKVGRLFCSAGSLIDEDSAHGKRCLK